MSTPQQPAPPQPQPQPQPPAQKSWFARHKILTGLGAVIVAIIAITAVSGGSGDKPSDAARAAGAATGAAEAPVDARIGTPVRDGKFEFVVNGVEAGVPSVGVNEYLTEKAQGQFVLVRMTVRNIGDRAQSFTTSAQKLVDAQDRQHSVDDMATITLDQGVAFEQINPGNSVEATIVFDVPPGTVPAVLEVHDSVFSGGESILLQ
ncbi:DUF4352 domain-containing protein [Prescottella agglutinans]|uniref:DUF4352 domain-containing protein n=1 Tax=Prescottella agglutinans TaxID=1644129 RepID=A0A438BAB7_9NOCA|nr:DUF4352 domain-containing protein [Prescottella agglutinans]RVW07946.1 DUF4352 domain-containing protein [Prescottella agglutinans]